MTATTPGSKTPTRTATPRPSQASRTDCTECDLVFTDISTLEKHVRKQHRGGGRDPPLHHAVFQVAGHIVQGHPNTGQVPQARHQAALHVQGLDDGQGVARVVGMILLSAGGRVGGVPGPVGGHQDGGVVAPRPLGGQEQPAVGPGGGGGPVTRVCSSREQKSRVSKLLIF